MGKTRKGLLQLLLRRQVLRYYVRVEATESENKNAKLNNLKLLFGHQNLPILRRVLH